MAEGVAASGGRVIADATFDNPKQEPPVDPDKAPLGWTWARDERRWRPRKSVGRGGNRSVPGNAGASPQADSPRPDRDPDPGWFAEPAQGKGDDEPGKRRFTIADVPAETQNDIAGFMGLIGTPILAMLQQIDPYCGGALAQNFVPVVDATLPLICRSERIVNYFKSDENDWLLWGKLALALRPVATAVLQHHVFRTVEVVRDQHGIAHVVPRDPRGQSEHGDHLQPQTQPEYNYAA